MKISARTRVLGLVAGGMLIGGSIVGFSVAPTRAAQDIREEDAYRVEMVNNDPYKVQAGLNALEKQGWYYVSAISRPDGKILLILRKTN
jgi:hypothetical protein